MRFEEKLKTMTQKEVWQEYCGFLELSMDEYMQMQAERDVMREETLLRTFREDYEFYGADEGTVTVDYSGSCQKCGSSSPCSWLRTVMPRSASASTAKARDASAGLAGFMAAARSRSVDHALLWAWSMSTVAKSGTATPRIAGRLSVSGCQGERSFGKWWASPRSIG